jgi:hypothetical protein
MEDGFHRNGVCLCVCVRNGDRRERRSARPKKGQQKKSSKTPFGCIIRQQGAMFLTLS